VEALYLSRSHWLTRVTCTVDLGRIEIISGIQTRNTAISGTIRDVKARLR